MSFRMCVTGYGRSLVPADGHNRCIACLGVQHAFVDSSCSHCENMTIAVLTSRLSFLGSQGAGVPSPVPRSAVFSGFGWGDGVSACRQGDLRITVRAFAAERRSAGPCPLYFTATGGAADRACWSLYPGCPLLPSPRRRPHGLSPLVAEGARLRRPPPLLSRRSSSLHPPNSREPVADAAPSPLRPSQVARDRETRDPETGDLEGKVSALRESTPSSLPPSEEGRGEFAYLSVPPLTLRSPAVPTSSQKEQFPNPQGHKRVSVRGPALPLTAPSHFGSRSQCVGRGRPQLSPIRTVTSQSLTPLRAAMPSESGPSTLLCCPTPGASVVPLVPLARCLKAWIALPSPSRWLIRTSDSAMRFSSPSIPRSSGVSTTLRCHWTMHLFSGRRLLSSWRRMQSSRSLQPI
ncbi:proline-rich protein 36-like [Ctenopharyngodon idella]|uniref:proline-rich protein 36-like n=1 Tax=Ctenopharyngodon idella TaxID=7959 RepID=UPI0022321F76|nr:proline-rich protein 36-like [Ctenopharyngodon idella]